MADVRHRMTFGNRFRFVLRLVGLVAVPVGLAGAVVFSTFLPELSGLPRDRVGEVVWSTAESASAGELGLLAQAGAVAIGVGLVVAVVWGLIEILGALVLAAGRKTAANSLNGVQIALACLLLVVVNAIAFDRYRKWDLTGDRQFTLTPELIERLAELRTDSPTTVVVLQLHKTAGTLSDKPDAIDYAAERKIVEKVRDVVDQLREFGPQFNVAVLDVEDDGFERKLKALTKRRPGLADAVREAPENSIFFYADGKVRREPRSVAEQLAGGSPRPSVLPDPDDGGSALVYPAHVARMSFTEFYQLDKTASREADPVEREGLATTAGGAAFAPGVPGRGNLVLIPQGQEAFIRKVLELEERRPRVALAVIHPLLSSRETYDEYSAAGLRRTLETNGYEVTDVILKRWTRSGPPAPAAYTYEESELDRAENRYNLLTLLVADRELAINQLRQLMGRVEKAPYAELNRIFGRQLNRPIRSEQDRAAIRRLVEFSIEQYQSELDEFTKQLADVSPQYRDLLQDERAAENRRVTDVKAKLGQYVADSDLLIVPRLTTVDLAKGEIIPPALFDLTKDQSQVVKDFLTAGKPVLFALGPTNMDRRGLGSESSGDEVEALLPRLGVELGRQTIVTDKEAQALAERQSEALGSTVDVPPLVFDPPLAEGTSPHPIAAAFRTTARAVDSKLDVKRSGYRPIYVAPGFAEKLPFAPEFAFTTRDSWNEEKPLPEDESAPRFDPAKPDDPKKGTRDEERRGPFPVGVAVEVPVPPEWARGEVFAEQQRIAALLPSLDGGLSSALLSVAADAESPRPRVRVVALGHGGLFTGKKLDPAAEALLLHAVNWQLRRDDRLPRDVPDSEKWRYPRVDLSERAVTLWRYGAILGLPLLCGVLGTIVLMIRKVR